jgi:hypothetical protein
MFPQCSHICVKRGTFRYRRRVPLAGGEVTISLRTLDYREARYRVGLLDQTFNRVVTTRAHMADLKAILKEQLTLTLRADLEQHLSARLGASVYGITPDDDQTTGHEHDLDLIDTMIGDAHERLVTRDTRLVMPLAVDLTKRHGVPEDQLTELAVGLLQVELQAMQTGKQRLLRGAIAPIGLDDQPAAGVVAAAEPNGPLLSEALPQFIDRMLASASGRYDNPRGACAVFHDGSIR